MRVAFVYARPREALSEEVARSEAPDTGLLGQNHLSAYGIEAEIRSSALRRRDHRDGLAHRVTWTARELAIPLELRRYDAICTALGPTLPLSSRAARGPRTLLFNMSLCQSLRRSRGAKRKLLAAGVRAADAVVCFAEAQRESLIELSGADPERIHTVWLGTDEKFLATDEPPPAGGPVLAVGRDVGRDYRTFAEAVSTIDAEIVLVASERNLKRVRLPSHVRLRLDVSAVELRTLYEQASCVVVPTRKEGYAYGADCSGQTVIVDAFAMGRPVVTSERSTLAGYVDNGRNGVIVPAEDPAALREAIAAILRDPELGRQLGAQGRRDVEERFTTSRMAESVAGILSARSVLAAPREARVGRPAFDDRVTDLGA